METGHKRKKYERASYSKKDKSARSIHYENEQREISVLRKNIGIPQIKKGERKCLRCDVVFFSEDLTRNKICYQCCVYNETAE